VDFDLRSRLLAKAETISAAESLQEWDAGLPKLWLITRTLALRQRQPDWFSSGSYRPLTAQGSRLGHLIGFVRSEQMITLLPRFTLSLRGEWSDTTVQLPAGRWENHFTGETHEGEVQPAHLFQTFPVALLTKLS
jgi:(1->4)-alpha-D-glucan 1-alpha-D-glucosylmutase